MCFDVVQEFDADQVTELKDTLNFESVQKTNSVLNQHLLCKDPKGGVV